MDFQTVLKNLLAVVETAALIGAMVMSTRGLRKRDDKSSRRSMLTRAAIYFAIYIALNMARLMYFQA